MKLASNPFTKAIAEKQKQIGFWVSLASPFAAEETAPAGYDWALIDMEHSPNDYFSVLGQLQAFAASETTAIVRPEWNDPVIVKRLLDMGVEGLLFPMIQTVEEAQKAVASTRYPPHGLHGFSGGHAPRSSVAFKITLRVLRMKQSLSCKLKRPLQSGVRWTLDQSTVYAVSSLVPPISPLILALLDTLCIRMCGS